jgi:hypothetical protein
MVGLSRRFQGSFLTRISRSTTRLNIQCRILSRHPILSMITQDKTSNRTSGRRILIHIRPRQRKRRLESRPQGGHGQRRAPYLLRPAFQDVPASASFFTTEFSTVDGAMNWNSWPQNTQGDIIVPTTDDVTYLNGAHAAKKFAPAIQARPQLRELVQARGAGS